MNENETMNKERWWPLSEGFPAEVFIAGMALGELQRVHAVDGVEMLANAWISGEDWRRIDDADDGSVLMSTKGEVLARKGEGDGSKIRAGSGSFLLLYPWDLLVVNEQVVGGMTRNQMDGELSPAATVEGVLVVGEGTRILPGVYIEGNVVIGKNCKIGPNCYIRGNTSIGDGVHIGQAVEVKNSIIGHETSVGHLGYVGDSILGNRVNFGAGTMTSNLRHDGRNHRTMVGGELLDTGRRKFGTVVGDGVHTGIHTAIYPGRKMGPGASTRPNETVRKDLG